MKNFPRFQKEIRIPTILGLILTLLGLGGTIFLVETGGRILSRAGGGSEPKNVTIVNLTDTSFSVSWLTSSPTRTIVEYREKSPFTLSRTALDIREGNTSATSRYTHFVTVADLKPHTEYEVALVGGSKTSSSSLAVTTGSSLLPSPHRLDPAFGTVLEKEDRPPAEALAFASFKGSQTLGTIVDPDGSWVIPRGSLRTPDGNDYFSPTRQDAEEFYFVNQTDEAKVTTSIDNDSPLPPVRLGTNVNFSQTDSQRHGPIIAQANSFGALTASASGPFTITYPEEGIAITSGKPAFKGTGVAGKRVIITISGSVSPLTGSTTVLENGSWTWDSPPLAPGKYLATVASFSEKDVPIAQSISFSILKSGTSVLQAATPSASRAPSPSPSPAPRGSPTASPSLAPSPSASEAASPSASPPPVTGTWEPTLLLLVLGLGAFSFGALTLAKQRSP